MPRTMPMAALAPAQPTVEEEAMPHDVGIAALPQVDEGTASGPAAASAGAAAGGQARVDEFLDRFNTGIRAAFFRHEVPALGYRRDGGFGAAAPDPERAAAVEVEIQPTLRMLDALVSPSAAVLGRFTIADCALAPVLFRTTRTGLDLTPHATLHALRASLVGRPSFARADPVG